MSDLNEKFNKFNNTADTTAEYDPNDRPAKQSNGDFCVPIVARSHPDLCGKGVKICTFLFSLLDDGKQDDKVHKKADMDQFHTVGGAHRVGTTADYLAAGLTDVIDDGAGEDYGEEDIDKTLRKQIRSVKDGMNYGMNQMSVLSSRKSMIPILRIPLSSYQRLRIS